MQLDLKLMERVHTESQYILILSLRMAELEALLRLRLRLNHDPHPVPAVAQNSADVPDGVDVLGLNIVLRIHRLADHGECLARLRQGLGNRQMRRPEGPSPCTPQCLVWWPMQLGRCPILAISRHIDAGDATTAPAEGPALHLERAVGRQHDLLLGRRRRDRGVDGHVLNGRQRGEVSSVPSDAAVEGLVIVLLPMRLGFFAGDH
mmetsp:Transcript_110162/g.296519  ORF Transcript_110162/g.296519 Transcript_110162/m.296519 type:complete len:205 (-) Transcript_110162:1238-1852(-)